MRTHILTLLLALILTACASHHRDVASVDSEGTDENQTQQARADGLSSRGNDFTR